MNGSQFKDYVVRIFKRTDKDTEIYEATTDIVADMRIQMKSELYKEEAYVAGIENIGEYKIGLPSDFGHLIGKVTIVDDASGYSGTLNKLSKSAYDEKYGDRLHTSLSNVDRSIPKDFCIYAGQIYLGNVPDAITYKYFINYTTEDFADILSTTDVVPFTDRYRRTLRAGVLMELYNGLEFLDEANYWKNEYAEGISKMISNDADNVSSKDGVSYHGI
jgi:hypothetical protein